MSLTLTRRHNVDRFGYLIPTKYGNVPMVGAVATYRPGEGRFGGAVAVEEGTTNLANNPTFSGAVGTTPSGWNSYVTIQQDDFFGQLINVAELLCVSGEAYESFGTSVAYPLAYDTTYTISFWARGTMELTYELSTKRGIASATWKSKPPMSLQWQRYEVTIATASSGSIYPFWWYLNNVNDVNVGKWVRIARIQLEQKPFATSFVDGTRAAGKLSYNLSLTNPHTGHLWMYAPYRIESVYYGGAAKDNSPLFELIDEATGDHLEFKTYRNQPYIDPEIGTYTSHRHKHWTPEAHTWYGVTWKLLPDNFIVEVRDVSGNLIQTWDAPSSEFANFHPTQLHLGVFGGAVLVDELLILPYAASEEEIVSWYEAQEPLPPHPQASLQWDRQTVRPAQMTIL